MLCKAICTFGCSCLLLLLPLQIYCFEKIVIWGHKLGTHTHAYVHRGFYNAFKQLGYPTYWFDDEDAVDAFDFANTLFLTEGQVDNNLPQREDCDYVIHNPRHTYYSSLDPRHCIYLQVYTDSVLDLPLAVKVDACTYYDLADRCLYMPWATDLLPEQIDEIKRQMPFKKRHVVYWIGAGEAPGLIAFRQACKDSGIDFVMPAPQNKVSCADAIKFTRLSYLAPTIVDDWQQRVGYIPARIFNNIACGQMGITNSKSIYQLFEGKVVYNSDTYKLFYDAQKRQANVLLEEQYQLMELVKAKHTYINRAQAVLDFLELVKNADVE